MKKVIVILALLAANISFAQDNACPSSAEVADTLKGINQQVRTVVSKAKSQEEDFEDADMQLRIDLRNLIIKLSNCGK